MGSTLRLRGHRSLWSTDGVGSFECFFSQFGKIRGWREIMDRVTIATICWARNRVDHFTCIAVFAVVTFLGGGHHSISISHNSGSKRWCDVLIASYLTRAKLEYILQCLLKSCALALPQRPTFFHTSWYFVDWKVWPKLECKLLKYYRGI